MPPMPTVRTTGELYPPARQPEFWNMLLTLTTGDRDQRGNFVLREPLTPQQRESLQIRSAALGPWLASAPRHAAAAAVTRMLIGFAGKPMSEKEATAVAAQYVGAMHGVPIWAVERTCTRFANGEVKPDEVGAKHLDRSFPPTTAQLRMVAIELVRPFGEEAVRIGMTLRGSLENRETPEEHARGKERIAAMHADFKARMGAKHLEEAQEDERQKAARTAEIMHREAEARANEYLEAGLEPPEPNEAGITVSLAMMLKSGWIISTLGDGRKVLLGPTKPAVPRSDAKERPTKPEQQTRAKRPPATKIVDGIA